MIFQYLDYPEFQTFYKLIALKSRDGSLIGAELDSVEKLASEHGISAEHVRQLVDMCS